GVHIHMSLVDAAGRPATHAPGEPMELSKSAQHFCAGVLHHMPAICAITAPSPVSYLRLTPNAWAPTVIGLVRQARGAGLRLAANKTVAGWLGPTHFDAYLRFKRVEAEKVARLSPAELCARYAEVY